MKKWLAITSLLTLSACTVSPDKFVGDYETLSTHKQDYVQKLSISPLEKDYKVSFSASMVKGRANCSFEQKAIWYKDKLLVNISLDPQKQIIMYIKPLDKNHQTVEVFTNNFDERFQMMIFCKGGASLAGVYHKK